MDTLNDALELVGNEARCWLSECRIIRFMRWSMRSFSGRMQRLIATVTPDWTKYLAKAQDLFLSNQKELSALITHRLPIRDTRKAFELYEQHEDGIISSH